ncbi:MAG: ADP-ribosylglycohydrolase family protein [Armatimonadota bacterium]
MKPIRLAERQYRDRVHACWLGKNIGGTLGTPYEGRKEILDLDFYDPVPDEPLPNDDLDLQLVWLRMVQQRGLSPSVSDFADYWLKHLRPYPWSEYGRCLENLERGLKPPISGAFENCFIDNMGSPIRSEIWACLCAGDPGLAASLAWRDSALDHAGGEGTYGEMFWAALQAAAFVISDPLTLIRIGLGMIPVHCQISRAIRYAVWCHQNDIDWEEARERMARAFLNYHPSFAPINHGFTIIGWLCGESFGDRLCAAVNCGWDTDCTGATLGATLGIIGGTGAIPECWREPVGEGIVLHRFTQDLDAPADVLQLTHETVDLGRRMLAERSEVAEIAAETASPADPVETLSDCRLALQALEQDPQSAIETVEGYEIALHYNGEPVMRPGISRTLEVSARRDGVPVECDATLIAPGGWRVSDQGVASGRRRFQVVADEVGGRAEVTAAVRIDGRALEASYPMLGPDEAPGFPCATGVETCPECTARAAACICPE